MTERALTQGQVELIVHEQLEILGRCDRETDARLASELRNRLGEHFIVLSRLSEGRHLVRCIATRSSFSCIVWIEANFWLKRQVIVSAPERTAVITAAPETKRPAAQEHSEPPVNGRKKRRSR